MNLPSQPTLAGQLTEGVGSVMEWWLPHHPELALRRDEVTLALVLRIFITLIS